MITKEVTELVKSLKELEIHTNISTPSTLQKHLTVNETKDSVEISTFVNNKPATQTEIITSLTKLASCFPNMKREQLAILGNILASKNKSADWINYAVMKMIEEYEYPTFQIASLLKIDRVIKGLSYKQISEMAYYNHNVWDSYKRVSIMDKTIYVLNEDYEKYKMIFD